MPRNRLYINGEAVVWILDEIHVWIKAHLEQDSLFLIWNFTGF